MRQPKGPSKRTAALTRARVAGFEGDTREFARLVVESRVGREALNAAWRVGEAERLVVSRGVDPSLSPREASRYQGEILSPLWAAQARCEEVSRG